MDEQTTRAVLPLPRNESSAAGAAPLKHSVLAPRTDGRWTSRRPRHCERSEAISDRERVGLMRPEIATSLRSSR
jgi:hypothetical protein